MKRLGRDGSQMADLMERLFDLVLLNWLFLLCCVPLFTIGASLTALHRVCLQMVRGDDAYHARDFFQAFRREFRQSTVLWLPMLVFLLVLYFDQAMLLPLLTGFYRSVLFIASLILELFLAVLFLYAFPLQARYANPVRQTVKNALLIGIWKFPYTVAIALIWLILPLLFFLVRGAQPVVMIGYLLCGFSLTALEADRLVNRVLKTVIPEEKERQEGAEQ